MRPFTPADVLSFSSLSDAQISPDGVLVVFVSGAPVKEFKSAFKSQIFVATLATGVTQAYTSGAGADWSPRWSPDGRMLAFLSDRDGHAQVYLLARDGGEARRVTNVRGEIDGLAWSPDGAQLAFLLADPEPDDLRQQRERGDDAMLFEQHPLWTHVWAITVASGDLRQVTTGPTQVWEFGWAPDGGFVLITGAAPYEWAWFAPCLAYVGPEGGEPRTIYTVPEKCFACPRVSPDGRQIAFLSGIWSDRGINAGDIWLLPVAGGEPRVLTEGYSGNVWWMQWSPDGAALDVLAYEQGEAAVGRVDIARGGVTTRWRGEVAFGEDYDSHYLANDGTIALVRSDAQTPQELWVGRDQSGAPEWQQLTHVNSHADGLALGETRTVRWQAADGLELQGILILPVGYEPGQRVPLVTWVHGGPAWLYTHSYYGGGRGLQAWAGADMAVFLPNPRGSVGWGVPFLEANIGDFGGADYTDIISGIDYLIAEGIADADRLAIGGWSYGGFMAAWAIGQTTRFKAAIVGAAIINWRSFHGAAHIGLWDRISLRADPYAQGGVFDTRSPIRYVAQVATPTLIVHGADDRIVPVDQGYEFYRALKDHHVAVEMVVYPREGHPIGERLHQLDRLTRYLDWLTHYLKIQSSEFKVQNSK